MPALNPARASLATISDVVPSSTYITLTDNEDLFFGASNDVHITFDTSDANANHLMVQLPEGGSVNVPVFMLGCAAGTDPIGTDLGLFNGITQTTLAVVDSDNDSYIALDFSADDTARIRVGGSATYLTSSVPFHAGTHDWGVGATGIAVDATNTMAFVSAARINAAADAGAYAASYSQMAVTATQTNNVSTFASWSELYFTGTTATNGNNAAVWAHVEVADTFTGPGSTSTYLGSVVGSLLSPATLTNTGIMGAFIADSVMTSGYTNNGTIAAFIAHVNASHPTKAAWPYGLWIQDSGTSTAGIYVGTGATRGIDCQNKVRVGTHDWGTGATGILLNGTDDDMVLISAGRINAAVTSGAYAASYNQLAVTATQTNNVSTFGTWSELYFSGTTSTNGNNAAMWGHLEISGTFTGPGSTSTFLGAIVGSILTPATVTNTGIMGAFVADSVMTSGFTNNGVLAAFVAHVNASHPTKANWPIALYIDGADVAFGFGSATSYEDGIKEVVATPAGNTTHAIKIDVGGVAGYIPVYAAETF